MARFRELAAILLGEDREMQITDRWQLQRVL